MTILFLTSRFPYPPDRGDRLRTFHFLRELAPHHEVRLVSFVAENDETTTARTRVLEELGIEVATVHLRASRSRWSVMRACLGARPFQVAYYDSSEMRARVAEASRGCSVVVAHLLRMAPYLESVPPGPRRIVDLCDCISSEYRESLPHRELLGRLFYAEEAKRVTRFERMLVDGDWEGWVISEAEIAKLGPGAERFHVVPNGVLEPTGERSTSPSATASASLPATTEAETGEPVLVFTGNLSVPHNVDAARFLAREILPLVQLEVPQARLVLAGAEPVPAVRELAGSRVEVTGWVDDLGSVLRVGRIFVAPMRFVAGVQNKVLEAMSFGLPVVTSGLVREGIGATDGRELIVAESAGDSAAAVVRILRDPGEAARLGEAGRQLVRRRFRWSAVRDRLEARD